MVFKSCKIYVKYCGFYYILRGLIFFCFFFTAPKKDIKKSNIIQNETSGKPEENDFDTSGFASETTEQEVSNRK